MAGKLSRIFPLYKQSKNIYVTNASVFQIAFLDVFEYVWGKKDQIEKNGAPLIAWFLHRMFEMTSKCINPMLWYSTGSEGGISLIYMAEKEHKMKLNHGYITFSSSSSFNSGDHVYYINQQSLKSKQV